MIIDTDTSKPESATSLQQETPLQSEETVGFVIMHIARLIRQVMQDYSDKYGLTYAQARALLHIARNPGVHQVQLAEILEIKPITLARLLDQLQTRELVDRQSDPEDRRAYRIYLSAKADRYLEVVEQRVDEIRNLMLEGIPAKDADKLTHMLNTVRHNLSTLCAGKSAKHE